MQSTIKFCEQTPYELEKYQIHNSLSNLVETFQDLYKTSIKSYIIDEKIFNIKNALPVGIIYKNNGRLYAMGVCNRVGEFNTDEFTCKVRREVKYTMWGPYQRVGWTAGEIEELVIWRKRLMDKPGRIYTTHVEKFEKSRWMLFCFWPGKLEDLVDLEMKLMDNVLEQDDLICGNMRRRIPKLYGLVSIEELKKMIKDQYEKTKFSLNEEEEHFVRTQAWFGKQIEQIYKN